MTSTMPTWAPLAYWERQSPTMRGIVLMCISTLCASAMHALVRSSTKELPPLEVVFFRNLFGLAVLLPLLLRSRFRVLRTDRIGLHLLRGLFNVLSMIMFFSALGITPLARVSALNFTAPIFMALMSVLFLGERFRFYRWLAIIMGFIGMLIILRPGLVTVDQGSILVIGSAVFWAVTMIFIKILSRTDSSLTIVAWMGISMCGFSLGPALLTWEPVSYEQLLQLLFIGICGSASQISLSQALKETDPTAIMPFDFLKLVWATLLGVWFFGELPDTWTWVGAAVIFASGLSIAFREKRSRAT